MNAIDAALDAAAAAFHAPRAHIIGHSRAAGLVLARGAVVAGVRAAGAATWPELAAALDRHEDTLRHALGVAKARARRDADYAAAVALVTEAVRKAHP